jgi:hypothetical protein
MIRRLIVVFLRMVFIWGITCSIAWIGGNYMHAFFNDFRYSLGWRDICAIARFTFVASTAFTLLAWINMRR